MTQQPKPLRPCGCEYERTGECECPVTCAHCWPWATDDLDDRPGNGPIRMQHKPVDNR